MLVPHKPYQVEIEMFFFHLMLFGPISLPQSIHWYFMGRIALVLMLHVRRNFRIALTNYTIWAKLKPHKVDKLVARIRPTADPKDPLFLLIWDMDFWPTDLKYFLNAIFFGRNFPECA